MTVDPIAPRSRRAILAASLGGAAAFVASAIGRAAPVDAADDQSVLVGGEHASSSVTKITIGIDDVAIWGVSGNVGVQGNGGSGIGVLGVAGSPSYTPPAQTGVYGISKTGTAARGVKGETTSGRGVFGEATNGRGVFGQAVSGHGVHGYASTGIAGWFERKAGATGLAIRAIGRVVLDNCSGVATIASGERTVTVNPGINLVATSAVVATLQGDAGGSTTVQRVAVRTANNTFEIVLTANATAEVKVAWHVFG